MTVYLIFKATFPTDYDGELLYAYLSSKKASDKISALEAETPAEQAYFYTRTIETSDETEICLAY